MDIGAVLHAAVPSSDSVAFAVGDSSGSGDDAPRATQLSDKGGLERASSMTGSGAEISLASHAFVSRGGDRESAIGKSLRGEGVADDICASLASELGSGDGEIESESSPFKTETYMLSIKGSSGRPALIWRK